MLHVGRVMIGCQARVRHIDYFLYIIFLFLFDSSSPGFKMGARHAIGILHVYCRRPIGYYLRQKVSRDENF